MISTVDPQARHARKTSAQRQDGYKAHIAAEPETGLVTECALTAAAAPDGPTGVGLLTAEQPGLEVLGDSAYGGGATRAALHAAGHTQTIKPLPLASAVPGGFTIHDFRIDHQAGMVRCPVGATAPITSSGRVSFARHCQGCPLRRRCTTAKGGRTIHLHPHEDELRAARRRATTRSFQQSYRRWRPMVERSLAWLVADGCRRGPTAASTATRCGGRCGSPRSTCAGCWHLALLVRTRPGHWPDQGWLPSRLVRAWRDSSPRSARPTIGLLRERLTGLDRQASAGS